MFESESKARIHVSDAGAISVRAADILASPAGQAQLARVATLRVAGRGLNGSHHASANDAPVDGSLDGRAAPGHPAVEE